MTISTRRGTGAVELAHGHDVARRIAAARTEAPLEVDHRPLEQVPTATSTTNCRRNVTLARLSDLQ
jgi:hypothetical protein